MKKLTATQRSILTKLTEGWELSQSGRGRGRPYTRVQQGGTGHGGRTEDVHANTLQALFRAGLVARRPGKGWPDSIYDITDAGAAALEGR